MDTHYVKYNLLKMNDPKTLNQYILEKATGFRCGVTLPFQEVETTFSDIEGVFNVSLPEDAVQPWQSASGSINRNKNYAILGAIAEAMERYSAAVVNFPIKKFRNLRIKKSFCPVNFPFFLKINIIIQISNGKKPI